MELGVKQKNVLGKWGAADCVLSTICCSSNTIHYSIHI